MTAMPPGLRATHAALVVGRTPRRIGVDRAYPGSAPRPKFGERRTTAGSGAPPARRRRALHDGHPRPARCPAAVAVVPCPACYGIRTVVESPVAEIVNTPTAASAVYVYALQPEGPAGIEAMNGPAA